MKASEIREKPDKELHTDLSELRQSLFKARMQRGNTQTARHHQFGQIRRDIARMETILRERSLAGDEAVAEVSGEGNDNE